MKILNLYAGVGGNRKLWGDKHEITAVELEPNIKYGMDDLIDGKSLWCKCKGQKYYFCDVLGFHQKEILSEDWEFVK